MSKNGKMKFAFLSTLLMLGLASFNPENNDRKINFPKITEYPNQVPSADKVWVFILAGQSNMAGRGFVEPQDTLPNQRIITINAKGELILAKEPLHFYEPNMAGLDCGVSFAHELLKHIPDSVSILLIPTAVGGSAIDQWLGDSLHRNLQLLTNFREKTEIAKKYGNIKGILWHQGESDSKPELIPLYEKKLGHLFRQFRIYAGNKNLPVLMGEIGLFADDSTNKSLINNGMHKYALSDPNASVIKTGDFKHRGDQLHFDSKSQRLLGERFANQYIQLTGKNKN